MRPAHACFRTALRQTFRSQVQTTPDARAVPESLVPAFLPSPNRTFSSTRRRHTKLHESSNVYHLLEQDWQGGPLKRPKNAQIEFQIPLPKAHLRDQIQAWLVAIDPFLPSNLRQTTIDGDDTLPLPASAVDFSAILLQAQNASQDILSHMGLVQGRWATLNWLIKKLLEDGPLISPAGGYLDPLSNVAWSNFPVSLDDACDSAIVATQVQTPRQVKESLNAITGRPEILQYDVQLRKKAFGQIWRSLGYMILISTEHEGRGHSAIMPHILEVIAYFHHVGMIPNAVYQYRHPKDVSALHQPPTLHLLSSRILSSLSDATWRAHESSVKAEQNKSHIASFLGMENPGSKYKTPIMEVSPEIWLELVLWSCLHGGWILDGTWILEHMLVDRNSRRWSLICWRNILENSQKPAAGHTIPSWDSIVKRMHLPSRTDKSDTGDRSLIQKTVSSEVVGAFVDGLVNTMRLGVGARGCLPEELVDHIKRLKNLLDRDNLSLGSVSWDSIIVRLLESGGIAPEKNPRLLLSTLDLISEFGTEAGSLNAPHQHTEDQSATSYCFDATAASIGLFHRALRSFTGIGNLSEALRTVEKLQDYTDSNKKRSMTEFFRRLRQNPAVSEEPFTSSLAPIDYPGFYPQIPSSLLAGLLDLVTDSRLFNVGQSLLHPGSVDGPLIARNMWSTREMAPALVRFGTAARANDLVLDLVKKAMAPGREGQRMPAEVLSAFLNSQIQHRRWESVRSIRNYINENPGYRPQAETISIFAAEVLRLSSMADSLNKSEKDQVRYEFADFLLGWQRYLENDVELKIGLNSILGVMSTVHDEVKRFCSPFFMNAGRRCALIRMGTESFNHLLDGILEGYGSLKGKRVVEMWCYTGMSDFEDYRAPGGLRSLPRYRASKAKEYEMKLNDIELDTEAGTFALRGRILLNMQTVRAILRKAVQEEGKRSEGSEQVMVGNRPNTQEMFRWAVKLLGHMGLDKEDIYRDLGDLAIGMPESDASKPPDIIGVDEENE